MTLKPLIKWVGGKTQILDIVLQNFPKEMDNYREIFVGGGSVLFGLLDARNKGDIVVNGLVYAYDINETLVHFYKNVQDNWEDLYEETVKLSVKTDETSYYEIRKRFNEMSDEEKKTPVGSAMFLFLNKTCFRGLYRESKNGFNVPYGNYKNPEIVNRDHLESISQLIQDVVFECCDFSVSLTTIEPDDFIYLDPPYYPETATSFVSYNKSGFNIEKHKELFDILCATKNKFLMSNSDVPFLREKFPKTRYALESILCKRSINAKNPEKKARELLLYPLL
jgi:DNA adenine methylase